MNLRAILNRKPWATPCLLVLVTLLAYVNSFPGAFILDDLHIAQHNVLVKNPDLITIFTTDYWHGYENSGLFRPVTILSFVLNHLLLGEAPLGFHLVNVLLHAGIVVLLWRLLLGWGVENTGAIGAAMFFAVHPIHTEVLNIVVGRNELLAAFFVMAAFLLARRQGVGWDVGVGACYLLALCSKEHVITFMALLPIVEFFFEGRQVWRRRWRLYAGLAVIAAVWLGWRYYFVILHNVLPRFPLTEAAAPIAFVDVPTRVLSSLLYQGLYLSKMLFPHGLQSVYSINDLPPFVRSIFSLSGILVVSGTGVVLALLVIGWRRRSLLALCGVLYLLSFLPTSNLLFPIGATVAERLAYLPSVWYCAGLGVALASLATQIAWRRWVLAAFAAYGVFLLGILLMRNPDYASEMSLWTAEVEENPRDFLGWQSLAESYNNQERYAEADSAYMTMLELAPNYPGGLRSRTIFFINQAMYEKALPTASKVYAISVAQNEPIAMAFDALDLAEIAMGMGNFEEALRYLDGPSLPLRDNLRALEIRAATLAGLGRHAEAVEFFARVEGEPKEHRIAYHYGKSLFHLKRLEEARTQLEKAVANSERDAEAWNLLGVVRAEQKDWPAAITAMERAVALAPDREHYRDNLERALREGR